MVWSPGPGNKQSRIPEHDSRDPEAETGSLKTKKRVHRIHGTLETGLHKDLSQPSGPHKGGRRIKISRSCVFEDIDSMFEMCNI